MGGEWGGGNEEGETSRGQRGGGDWEEGNEQGELGRGGDREEEQRGRGDGEGQQAGGGEGETGSGQEEGGISPMDIMECLGGHGV